MKLDLATFADIVAFCDPASGKTGSSGKKRCRTAIVVVGQREDGPAFLLEAVAGQWPTDRITETIFQVNDQWKPKRFGVEASAQQSLYVDTLIKEAGVRHKRILIVPVEQPTVETKEFRITTEIQKWMHSGLLYVEDSLADAKKELESYPTGQTCDIVDALSSALHMLHDPFTSRQGLKYEVSTSYNGRKFGEYRRI